MRLNIKKALALLMALCMLFVLCGCESWNNFRDAFLTPKDDPPDVEDVPKVIKIGVLEPLTGSDAADAAEEIDGIKLANSVLSEIDDVKLELVFADNQSDVAAAAAAAQSLIDEGVQFIIGSYKSVLTLAASDVIKEAGIPAITATNTNPLITKTNSYYFRACYVDSRQGEAAAEFVLNSFPETESVAILVKDGYDIGTALASQFRDVFEEGNPEAEINSYTIPENVEDYEGYFKSFEENETSVIFFPSQPSVAQAVIARAKELGYEFSWVGTDSWIGLEEDGVFYTTDYNPNSVANVQFNKAFALEHGNHAVASDACALGYDAYYLIYTAIENAGVDAEVQDYIDALKDIKNLPGATGSITMSGSGDPIKEISVIQRTEDGLHTVFKTIPRTDERSE